MVMLKRFLNGVCLSYQHHHPWVETCKLLTQPWSHFPYFAFTVNHNIARWLLIRLSYFLNHQLKWIITSVIPLPVFNIKLLFPSLSYISCVSETFEVPVISLKPNCFVFLMCFFNDWYVHLISEFTNVKETQLIKISNGFCFLKWLPT